MPAEKRTLFLERIRAGLEPYGGRLTDDELNAAIALAMTGLIRQPAA